MKHLYYSIYFFAAFILIACNSRAQKKLAVIGSSTSACFNVSIDSCYVTRLGKYYQDNGMPIVIDNKARAGDQCYQGMPSSYTPPPGRVGPATDRNITAALAGNPDVVLINYPSNSYNVLSVAEVMACLRTMKQAANNAGKPCYITTTQPRTSQGSYPDTLPSFNTPEVKLKMITLKDSILNQFGSFAINFWDGIVNPSDTAMLPQYNSGDSTHLTSAGHKVLSDRVIAANIFSGTALPVTFTAFSAYISNRQTFIQWTTAIEEGISSYNIERSNDGASFYVIQQIPARRQARQNSYSVVDQSPASTRSYYRVVAISNSGQPAYTKVIQVVSNSLSYLLQKIVVSGPSVRAELHAAEKQVITVQLVNNTGQVLSKMTTTINAGFNTILLPASLPGNGIYFIRILNSKLESQVKSFIKE